MTQQSTNKNYHTFVRGIITEAGPLTFPENAALDIDNVVLSRKGALLRRLGMDFEDDFVLIDTPLQADDAVAAYLWENAANDAANQFGVVQAGHLLHFFDLNAASASANRFAFVDLSAYINPNAPIQVASGLGKLFITSGVAAPIYLTYDPVTQGVSVTQYPILIRDVFGVEDNLEVSEQPAALTVEHHYNLFNQGWDDTRINAYKAENTVAPTAVYPANSQQWFVGKDTDDNFDPILLKKQDFGTTPAPRGRYIIDSSDYTNSRNLASGLTLPAAADIGRPSAVVFAFQRLFYSGVKSQLTGATGKQPDTSGFIYYTRTLRSVEDAKQCYAEADPTSEFDSELVDTDGGFINIPNCGHIYKLLEIGTYVVVFAEKGVWGITGGDGGFTATVNQVVKLSNFGVLSASSVVDAEDRAYYWNRGGIYLLETNEVGLLSARNITEDTIQTLFNDLPQAAKETAVGSYDPVNRRVTWMYNRDPDYTTATFRNRYDGELVLDTVLGAFYKHSISSYDDPSPYIAGYVLTPNFVTDLEGERPRGNGVTKYLTVQFIDPDADIASVSFAHYRDQTFRDWKSLDGVGSSYLSYILTGYEIMGDSARDKQTPYVTTHFTFTETEAQWGSPEFPVSDELFPVNPSGCILQAQWDWSNSPESGKWSSEINAYRLLRQWTANEEGPVNYGQAVITNKHNIPGSGKALSLYFRSDGDKDFQLQGWSTRFTGQANV